MSTTQSAEHSTSPTVESQAGQPHHDDEKNSRLDSGMPDGGLTAWLQVAGCFILFFNTWGMANTFGVFQTYYSRELLADMSPSAISWIGSIQGFFLLVVGVVTGPLYDAGHLRLLLISGTALVFLGLMMLSLCTTYWQVLLSQGVCVGIGTGFLYIPALALIPQYFEKHRAIATGVVTSGSSLGGVIYSLVFQRLVMMLGFAWAVRIIAFIALAVLLFSLAVLRRRTAGIAGPVRTLLDRSAFHERPYVLYCLAMWLSYVGFWVPVFYLQPYALTHGMQRADNLALYLNAIYNSGSVPGRLLPSLLARKIGPVQTLFLSCALTGVAVFSWIGTTTAWGNITFAVAMGFFSGGMVALPAVTLASITRDLSRIGTRLGMSSLLNAFGSLIGPPAAGAILDRAGGDYIPVQVFAGVAVIACSVVLVALRVSVTGRKWIAAA
ncbi:riboflavin transporter MCH5 [Microdochium trichocladiopsis]|uniref:Riboflavin transporter MCH5 n=1 Tax=Microdochium trichocladiopsis TaxID=1682393 RepID=A0A9P9BNV2_9PEZI|nr:riboflavin transporter MCH5 [Microdochium trichocladiopsis]KAH7031621.1 riboflavin transporter MCH5 [Microdochium trichocladiopsis]